MNGLFDWMSCLYFDICFLACLAFSGMGVCLFVCLFVWSNG